MNSSLGEPVFPKEGIVNGEIKTKDIMSNILIIMLSNLHGNTMEAFKLRLKGEGVEGSSFLQELAVIINFFRIMPVILFKMVRYKLFASKRDRKNAIKATVTN